MDKELDGTTPEDKAVANDKTQPKKSAPKKRKKDAEEGGKNSAIEINPTLDDSDLKEAANATVVLGWGRMNPITIGHEKLVNKIKEVARKERAKPQIFLTHSQDAKKNPLPYEDKVALARKAFGNLIVNSNAKTIIQVMQELQKGFGKVILVVGDDRVQEFQTLLNKYNGKDYKFESIAVVSAGERDPDADDVTGMSASKMRALASTNNFAQFKKGLPKALQGDAQSVFDLVRSGMKLAEELEAEGLLNEAVLTYAQRRKRGLIMRKYKNRIKLARERQLRKAATMDKLKQRARKRAINIIRAKIAGKKGTNYAELSPGEKMLIDKRVAKRKAAIDRIAKRLVPVVRKADLERLASRGQQKESVDVAFEMFLESDEMKKSRYHQMFNKEGKMKFDGRFRMFREKQKEIEEAQTELQRVRDDHKSERESMKRRHKDEVFDAKRRDLARQQTEEFADDKELLDFIEAVSTELFTSIELDEMKIEDALAMKAEKANAPVEMIMQVYEEALAEGSTEYAFDCVNVYIAEGKKKGLWDNIHAKRKRIKAGSGERMRKPGSEGAPTAQDFKNASESIAHALDPKKTLKHAMKDAIAAKDRDMDGDVDALDKKKIATPDEVTGAEKVNITKQLLKKYAKEKIHTKKGVAYEEVQLEEGINDPGIFKAVFLAGGPGSGKSFIVGKTALTSFGLKLINSDDAFEAQLKKVGLKPTPEDIFSDKGQEVRGRAKALTSLKQKLALNGRLGLVIDGTGKDFDKIKKQAEELRRIGYDVAMIFVNTDLDTAQARNAARARTLPADEVEKMWKDVQKNIGKFQNFFGRNMFVLDNSEGAQWEGAVQSAYKRIQQWTKEEPKAPAAKKWIAAAKAERGIKEEVTLDEARSSTLADLDVEKGDNIKFYASKANPRQEATVVGFKNGKVEVKPKGGNRTVVLDWTHEAVFAESVEIDEAKMTPTDMRKARQIIQADGKLVGPAWQQEYKRAALELEKKYGKDWRKMAESVEEEVELDEAFENFSSGSEQTNEQSWAVKGINKVVFARQYAKAAQTLKDLIIRKTKEAKEKGMRSIKHSPEYYASEIIRTTGSYGKLDARVLAKMATEELIKEGYGENDFGTKSLTDKYKEMTPGESKKKSFKEMNEEVTQKQIKDLEVFADRLLNKFDIDIEFTRHFADRMNDARNKPEIKISELQQFFKKIAAEKGKNIKQNADAEVVLKDMQKDLNLPVVINYKKDRDEFEVVNKTIMRKKGFATSNKTIEYK